MMNTGIHHQLHSPHRSQQDTATLFAKVLAQQSDPAVEWLGFREVREVTCQYGVRDNLPDTNSRSESHGVMVEVLVNGQLGYAATARISEQGLHQAINVAKCQAQNAAAFTIYPLTQAQRPKNLVHSQSTCLKPFDHLPVADIYGELLNISQRLKISEHIVKTTAFARTVDIESYWYSSNGSDASQHQCFITTDFEATAQNGSIVQSRSDGGLRSNSHQGGWEFFLRDDLWRRVDQVARQALELAFDAIECPSGTMDLVLMPDQMMLQIHESIGHPLELDRILGDERNYAGWSFVKPSDFGHLQYGSPLMNVTFDPTDSKQFASYSFDDTGAPAQCNYLIKEGILVRGLGGLESQLRLQLDGVANMRATSWNRAPIDRMANINLEPGSSSLYEMIDAVQYGILMTANRSWSIDDFRNKFQFGCEYGALIENGRLTKTVRNPNYRGITVPFWHKLKKVGDASTFSQHGTPYCGKGEPNQIIRVGHASPACLFTQVDVFGGL